MRFWSTNWRAFTKYQNLKYGERYWLHGNYYFRFRQGPVPNIHHWNASSRGCFRSGINCLQEKREWYKAKDELKDYGFTIRSRRTPKNLPSDYDDISYSHGYSSQSWKNCTKKRRQWGGTITYIYCG
jgi:hypothetical protein